MITLIQISNIICWRWLAFVNGKLRSFSPRLLSALVLSIIVGSLVSSRNTQCVKTGFHSLTLPTESVGALRKLQTIVMQFPDLSALSLLCVWVVTPDSVRNHVLQLYMMYGQSNKLHDCGMSVHSWGNAPALARNWHQLFQGTFQKIIFDTWYSSHSRILISLLTTSSCRHALMTSATILVPDMLWWPWPLFLY